MLDGINATNKPTLKMDPAVKARWLQDLRSGEYKQGRSHLRDVDGRMCCLGVLANQFNPEWVSDGGKRCVPVLNGENLSSGGIETDNMSGKLSYTFLDRVGISLQDSSELMQKNDTGTSFATIADYIEEHL